MLLIKFPNFIISITMRLIYALFFVPIESTEKSERQTEFFLCSDLKRERDSRYDILLLLLQIK